MFATALLAAALTIQDYATMPAISSPIISPDRKRIVYVATRALLKDSSLVSVITVVELTKQTQIFATNIGSWLVPGAMCAMLYLILSLPLSRLAGKLEARWKAPTS